MTRESLRLLRLIWGLFLYAVGIVMTVHANLGVAPWDVFHQGVSRLLGLTFGVASIVVSILIVAAAALFKERVGVGTLFNVVLIGVFIDVLMQYHWIPISRSFAGGVVMMLGGLFVIALASYFYMGAGYGAGPRDSLMVVLARRTGQPIGLCRAVIEALALVCGWLLGGHAGIGTIISAFSIGFAVQVVFTLLHFDPRSIQQESFAETRARLCLYFQARKK